MTPQEFRVKWSKVAGTEKQFYREHFVDICRMLHQPEPSAADHSDLDYSFERAVTTASGNKGFADVWKRGYFAWEYKGDGANLDTAYVQLLSYAGALDNPPLLVVSDSKRIRIHTNFTNKAKKTYDIPIEQIDKDANQTLLRFLFTQPEMLDPGTTIEDVTEEMAAKFGSIAANLQARGEDPHQTAHFLVQILFCLFAEDTTILPRGLVSDLLAFAANHPAQFVPAMTDLLTRMESGGYLNYQEIPHVNGGLFREINVLALDSVDLKTLAEAAKQDWSAVEPAIFGTLFERSLDPSSRARLGAHYTGKDDILRVVEPVVMTPLRRRWEHVRLQADVLAAKVALAKTTAARDRARQPLQALLFGFREELAAVKILDPACGSGNFLYVALERLLELDKDVTAYAASNGLSGMLPVISTDQLLGLEINEYARELAQVVIWIGYLQWMIRNGYGYSIPVLSPLETIRLQDALLDLSDPDHPKEAEWPEADFIIGNPPFLGRKELRGGLGDTYIDRLFQVFKGSVSPTTNLCGYFLEKARKQIETGNSGRAGLLATENIRFQDSREVLNRIKKSGDIFLAWSDEPWTLDGASVRISIIGFDDGTDNDRVLDGHHVPAINPDLSSGVDLSAVPQIRENKHLAFMGLTLSGPFDLDASQASPMLTAPLNVNGRPNTDVVRPYRIGSDITGRPKDRWVIDFGTSLSELDASQYELPFEYVVTTVRPERAKNNREVYRERWWIHAEARSGMRSALQGLTRYLATVLVSKHHLLVWMEIRVAPANRLIVFARDDDYFMGVLQSRAHEIWALKVGARHGVGNDPTYNVSTCFETFPLPWPPNTEPVHDPRVIEIGAAAKDLDDKRNAWLNPPDASEAELKKRTLTNLYNARPTWLRQLHERLDRAVWAAYGWKDDPTETTDEQILERLLALNQQRARPHPKLGT